MRGWEGIFADSQPTEAVLLELAGPSGGALEDPPATPSGTCWNYFRPHYWVGMARPWVVVPVVGRAYFRSENGERGHHSFNLRWPDQ